MFVDLVYFYVKSYRTNQVMGYRPDSLARRSLFAVKSVGWLLSTSRTCFYSFICLFTARADVHLPCLNAVSVYISLYYCVYLCCFTLCSLMQCNPCVNFSAQLVKCVRCRRCYYCYYCYYCYWLIITQLCFCFVFFYERTSPVCL